MLAWTEGSRILSEGQSLLGERSIQQISTWPIINGPRYMIAESFIRSATGPVISATTGGAPMSMGVTDISLDTGDIPLVQGVHQNQVNSADGPSFSTNTSTGVGPLPKRDAQTNTNFTSNVNLKAEARVIATNVQIGDKFQISYWKNDNRGPHIKIVTVTSENLDANGNFRSDPIYLGKGIGSTRYNLANRVDVANITSFALRPNVTLDFEIRHYQEIQPNKTPIRSRGVVRFFRSIWGKNI